MKDNKKIVIRPSEVIALSMVERLFEELEKIQRKPIGKISKAEIRHWKTLKEMQKAVMQ